MARFLVRRVIFAVLLVFISSSAALFLTRLAPGDLASALGPNPSGAEVAAARARFDLDRPAVEQWGLWMSRALRFDFGESLQYGRPVGPLVVRAAANSAVLGITALAVATLLGIGLGIFTGAQGLSGGLAPVVVRAFSVACLSLPPLVTSLILVFIAARTGWFPLGGMTTPGIVETAWGPWLADVAAHLPLPVIALALPVAATFERLQSQALGETLHLPFVAAASARGVSRRSAILHHAWPVSLRAICAIYGIVIGAVLSGSFVVEYVTAWPGLGRMMYEALRARDIYLVAGCAAMGASFLALGTLAGDLLLVAVDPRVREGVTE
ncbi:MAG TPA: ABC transporter permease [Vicinamibacterales bacterium]|nr:ABC transporter permease [Vicinamibacterales bacterium]